MHPRPDAWGKGLIAPACFVLAATSTGRFGAWNRFVVLWLVLELLIYPARYQWNDIRGIDADQAHAERDARSRLPVGTTAPARRRGIRLSRLAAAARILVALLIGVLAGLARQALVLAGAVFVVAVPYEWLRASRSQSWRRSRVIAVWLVVGLGYVVRGGVGLSTAGLAWDSPGMAAGLVCVGSFGIMFVLLTWALEAASYCAARAGCGALAGHRQRVQRLPRFVVPRPGGGRVPAGGGAEEGPADDTFRLAGCQARSVPVETRPTEACVMTGLGRATDGPLRRPGSAPYVHRSVDHLCKTAPKLCADGEKLGIPVAARGCDKAITGENTIHTLCTTRKLELSTCHTVATRK